MRKRLWWAPAIAALCFAGACGGEDKEYGDPLEDPNAALMATAAVSNTLQLRTDTFNDTALNVVNALSGNVNLLAGIKLQHLQGDPEDPVAASLREVDTACVVISNTGIVYDDCDWAGNTVNGSVTRNGDVVSLDLDFYRADEDSTTTITTGARLTINDAEITGFLDIDLRLTGDGFKATASFDTDFAVDLTEGCAVSGDMELHAVAGANGRSESVWVLAEYGPTCGDVVVR